MASTLKALEGRLKKKTSKNLKDNEAVKEF
jgi:hypothetical protein